MTIALDRELASRSYAHFLRMAWKHSGEQSEFVQSWHIEQMCEDAQALVEFRLTDLVYCLPPGSGKSSVFSVFLPAWVWASRSTGHCFFYASFDLSLLNLQSDKMQILMRSDWYRARWPHVNIRRDPDREVMIDGGGSRYNTTFLGGGTGRHAHTQIIDDPIKPKDVAGGMSATATVLDNAWRTIHDTYSTRKKDPLRFGRMLVMQRLSEDDPAGRAIQEGWTPRVFPMVFNATSADPFDKRTEDGFAALEAKEYDAIPEGAMLTRRTPPRLIPSMIVEIGGMEAFWTQYQQLPSQPGGQIIKEVWLDPYRYRRDDLGSDLRGFWGQSWDFAFKAKETSDYVSGGQWFVRYEPTPLAAGKFLPHYYLMPDPFFRRATFTECRHVLRSVRDGWPGAWSERRPRDPAAAECCVEDKANGTALEDDLSVEFPGWFRLIEPKGSKVVRLTARTRLFEFGQVHLPDGPDYERIKTTLMRFPNVKHDDEVDMISQALGAFGQSALFIQAMQGAIVPTYGRTR